MIDIKQYIILLCCSLVLFKGYTQEDETIRLEVDSLEYKPWQIKRLGKKADKANDIYSAIDYFKIFTELKPDKKRYSYVLAELYREARDYTNAMSLYATIYEEVPEQFPKALYWHGIMKIYAEADYEGAKETLEEFEENHKPVISTDKKFKKFFKVQMLGIDTAPGMMENELDVILTHLDTSINKAHTEFSPFFYDENTMIYGSLPQEGIEYISTAEGTKTPTRKFYTANREFDDWRSKQKELEGPFNSDSIDVGNGTFSLDKKRFYFTRCERNIALDKVICSIYQSVLDSAGKWSEPSKMGFGINNEEYTSSHPSVGIEPKTGSEVLYFSSDRPGGKGGMDIWFTYYRTKKQEWKTPKKSSSKINSIGDEVTPFYDNDTKTLYFSSNSHPGLGGLDIFKTQGQLNKFPSPTNIGYPINSNVDDLDFAIAPSQEEGFFISNRVGGVALKNETCCDDIYHFLYTKYIKIYIEGKILEEITDKDSIASSAEDSLLTNQFENNLISDATITLFLVDDKTGEKIELKSESGNELGEYLMKVEQGNTYEVVYSKEGYFKQHVMLSTKEITESDTLGMDNVRLSKIPAEPIVVKNIYYPFDKAHLTESSQTVIDTTLYKILIDNPEIIIEVSSHTDSKGSESYNERLSQQRAESVVKYLIAKGIDKDRLKAKGYGESKPIAPNENEDGTDNEEGRAKNRRTEFKIIGIVEDASDIIYED